MAQPVKMLAAQPDDPVSMSGIPMVEEDSQFPKADL